VVLWDHQSKQVPMAHKLINRTIYIYYCILYIHGRSLVRSVLSQWSAARLRFERGSRGDMGQPEQASPTGTQGDHCSSAHTIYIHSVYSV